MFLEMDSPNALTCLIIIVCHQWLFSSHLILSGPTTFKSIEKSHSPCTNLLMESTVVYPGENTLMGHFKRMLLKEKIELLYHKADLECFVTRLNG